MESGVIVAAEEVDSSNRWGGAILIRRPRQTRPRLSDIAAREEECPERLQLEPLPRARCLKRLDHPLDAHDGLATFLQAKIRSLPAGNAREFLDTVRERPSLLGGLDDEADETMRPMIVDVTEELRRDLSK